MCCPSSCSIVFWCFRQKSPKTNFSASFTNELCVCFVAVFNLLSLFIYKNAQIKAESQILFTWPYSCCKALTVNVHQDKLLKKTAIFRKLISGSRVTSPFPRRSLSSSASQYFWKLSHEKIFGVDLFIEVAPVLQDTASQHHLANFYVSENTEENYLDF